jgi:hypothetical protein
MILVVLLASEYLIYSHVISPSKDICLVTIPGYLITGIPKIAASMFWRYLKGKASAHIGISGLCIYPKKAYLND